MATKKYELPQFELAWIPATKINVLNGDDGYQRKPSNAKIKKIYAEYDKNLVNPVKVYESLGTYYAFNGQHTLLILKTVIGEDAKVPCLVYDIDDNEAALLFEKQNGVCSNPSIGDKHKSKMFRGDKTETRITHIIESYGFTIVDVFDPKRKNNFRCFKDIDDAYESLGDNDFEKMIRLIKQCWFNDKKNTSRDIVVGLSQFIKKFGSTISEEQMKKSFEAVKPEELVKTIHNNKTIYGANRYIGSFIDVYNYRRKNKVSI